MFVFVFVYVCYCAILYTILLNSNQQDWHLAKEVSGGCLTLIRRKLFCLEVEESHPGKHENREKDVLHGATGILML